MIPIFSASMMIDDTLPTYHARKYFRRGWVVYALIDHHTTYGVRWEKRNLPAFFTLLFSSRGRLYKERSEGLFLHLGWRFAQDFGLFFYILAGYIRRSST